MDSICGFNKNIRDNDYVKKLQQAMEYESKTFNTEYTKPIYLFAKNIREDELLLNKTKEYIAENKVKDVLFSFKIQDQKAESIENIISSVEAICEKYTSKKERVITGLKRISKPGLRVYAKNDEIPKVLNGFGIAIVSTSKGIMTDKEARKENLGGEVMAYIW